MLPKKEFLRSCDVLTELTDEEFDRFWELSKNEFIYGKLKRGQYLYKNDTEGRIHFIASGILVNGFFDINGTEFPAFFLPEGAALGVADYILTDGKSNEDVLGHVPKAYKSVTYYAIPAHVFHEITKEIPNLYRSAAKYCASCYMDMINMNGILRGASVKKRIANYFVLREHKTKYTILPNFMMGECSVSVLADMIGMGRSTVSREIHSMERMGLISLTDGEIIVNDLEALKAYADE